MVKDEPVDPEALAAFLDGELDPEERATVFERLSRSQGDYEALVEAMRIRRDLEADAGTAPPPVKQVTPVRRLPGVQLWVPLAAVLAGALLVPPLLHQEDGAPWTLLHGASLVRSRGDGSLAAALGEGWDEPGWSGTRGDRRTLTERQRVFRIGVRLVDLELASGADDARAVRDLAPELASLVAGLGSEGDIVAEYQEIGSRATGSAALRDLDANRARAAEELADILGNSPWFGLGVWAEQARLAAVANRTEFFDERTTHALDEQIARLVQGRGEGAEVVQSLRGLRRLLDSGASPGELGAIRATLATVILESGG